MEASEMLDLLHYYFESDNSYTSEEQLRSVSKIRETLYESLYGVKYKYKYVPKDSKGAGRYSSSGDYSATADFDDLPQMSEEEAIKPFNPRAEKPKEFIPPTQVDATSAAPFGDILDAPLG